MIKLKLTFLSFLISSAAFSQLNIDTTIKLDLLRSPASPAFNILGISTNEIERPTDLNSFTLSLQEATNNFSAIPKSYAFQLAPFLFSKKKYTLNDFDKGADAFKQSFLISVGFTHKGPDGLEDVDSLKTTKLGLGLKFSIVRPEWSTRTRVAYTDLIAEQSKLLNEYYALEKKDANYAQLQQLRKERQVLEEKEDLTEAETAKRLDLVKQILALTEAIDAQSQKQLSSTATYEKLKKAASAFKSERQGFFLDFSGGFALDFPDNRFNNSKVYRGGMWLTGGHENGNKGFSYLFIARYLHNPETVFADGSGTIKGDKLSTLDAGGKLLIDASGGKFSFNAESIYRSVLNDTQIKPSWRLVLNTEYDLGLNKRLTFSFGRDFDGAVSKGGNLIAAFNFIAGLGGERKISGVSAQ